TEAGDDCPPGEIPAVVVDDEETSRVRSDVDGGDPHRLRPGRPGGVADALDHTGDDTVERLDPGGDQLPHRVGVAGGEVGVVGVEALHAPGTAPDSPAGPRLDAV